MLIMTECYRFPGEILTVHIVFIDIHILHNEHSLLIVTKISYPLATKDVPTVFSQIPRLHFDTVCQAMLCILYSYTSLVWHCLTHSFFFIIGLGFLPVQQ